MSENDQADPVIDEIRAVLSQISARFGHDTSKLVEHYIELQKRHAKRLLNPSEHQQSESKATS
jgi:hypothetical protein